MRERKERKHTGKQKRRTRPNVPLMLPKSSFQVCNKNGELGEPVETPFSTAANNSVPRGVF